MSTSRERTDQILDEIDSLVDWQLSGGDSSDSFHGEQYDRCQWCGYIWHGLPITARMQELRDEPYAYDEFGYAIVDPEYKYSEDMSDYVCPGAEWVGPPTDDREWKWAKQKWGRRREHLQWARSAGNSGYSYNQDAAQLRISEPIPGSPLRVWEFIGPFEPWTVIIQHDVEIDYIHTVNRHQMRSQTHHAVFEFEEFILTDSTFIRANYNDIESIRYMQPSPYHLYGQYARMKSIKLPFHRIEVFQQDQSAIQPDSVRLSTDYPIEHHPWWMKYWQLIEGDPLSSHEQAGVHRPSFVADLLIMDETREMTLQEMETNFVPLGTLGEDGIQMSTVSHEEVMQYGCNNEGEGEASQAEASEETER